MSNTVIKKYFKILVLTIFLMILMKSCIVPYNSSEYQYRSAQTANEFAKSDKLEESVVEVIKLNDKDDFIRTTVIKFVVKNGDTIRTYQRIKTHEDLSVAFLPEGGKYKMVYHPKRPKGRSLRIFMNEPVYDSTQVFERTEARITREFFINYRFPIIHYGGLQLIFKYKVDNKEYISHNGITLREAFPDVENPEEELSFVGKKFVVEYDVDNPYIARILLDVEVKK